MVKKQVCQDSVSAKMIILIFDRHIESTGPINNTAIFLAFEEFRRICYIFTAYAISDFKECFNSLRYLTGGACEIRKWSGNRQSGRNDRKYKRYQSTKGG